MTDYAPATRDPWSTRPLQPGERVEMNKGPLRGTPGTVVAGPSVGTRVWVKLDGFDKPYTWPRRSVRRIR